MCVVLFVFVPCVSLVCGLLVVSSGLFFLLLVCLWFCVCCMFVVWLICVFGCLRLCVGVAVLSLLLVYGFCVFLLFVLICVCCMCVVWLLVCVFSSLLV